MRCTSLSTENWRSRLSARRIRTESGFVTKDNWSPDQLVVVGSKWHGLLQDWKLQYPKPKLRHVADKNRLVVEKNYWSAWCPVLQKPLKFGSGLLRWRRISIITSSGLEGFQRTMWWSTVVGGIRAPKKVKIVQQTKYRERINQITTKLFKDGLDLPNFLSNSKRYNWSTKNGLTTVTTSSVYRERWRTGSLLSKVGVGKMLTIEPSKVTACQRRMRKSEGLKMDFLISTHKLLTQSTTLDGNVTKQERGQVYSGHSGLHDFRKCGEGPNLSGSRHKYRISIVLWNRIGVVDH